MKTLEELRQEMDKAFIDSLISESYGYATTVYMEARKAYYKAVLDARHAKNFADMTEHLTRDENVK
jgi:hypothetical protein